MPNDFNVGNAVKQLIWTGVITGGRLAQSLDYLPNAHGADFDAPQQPGPLRRQRVRRPYRQQGPQARQRTADAPRFHTQQIQQRPAFVFTGWAPIAGYGGVQAAPARHPGYCLGVMPLHSWADCTAHMWATGSGASRPRHSPCLARLSACGRGTGPPLPVPAPAKPDAAGPPGLYGRRTRLTLFGQEPPASRGPAATPSLGCTMAPPGRMALFSPRLIKQKTA